MSTPSLHTVIERHWHEWRKQYPAIREIEMPGKYFLYRQGDSCTDFFWIKKGIVKLGYTDFRQLISAHAELSWLVFDHWTAASAGSKINYAQFSRNPWNSGW